MKCLWCKKEIIGKKYYFDGAKKDIMCKKCCKEWVLWEGKENRYRYWFYNIDQND